MPLYKSTPAVPTKSMQQNLNYCTKQITSIHKYDRWIDREMDIYHKNEVISNHYYVAGDKLLKVC